MTCIHFQSFIRASAFPYKPFWTQPPVLIPLHSVVMSLTAEKKCGKMLFITSRSPLVLYGFKVRRVICKALNGKFSLDKCRANQGIQCDEDVCFPLNAYRSTRSKANESLACSSHDYSAHIMNSALNELAFNQHTI